tara:strand:- start:33 stop:857 length:825 start_codon:yes stop_codon:yes gene_type:complete
MEFIALTLGDLDTGKGNAAGFPEWTQWYEMPTYNTNPSSDKKEYGQYRNRSDVMIGKESECVQTVGGDGWAPFAFFADHENLPGAVISDTDPRKQIKIEYAPEIDLRGQTLSGDAKDEAIRFCSMRVGAGPDNPFDSFEAREMRILDTDPAYSEFNCNNRDSDYTNGNGYFHKRKTGEPSLCQRNGYTTTKLENARWDPPAQQLDTKLPHYGCPSNENLKEYGNTSGYGYFGTTAHCSEVTSKRTVQLLFRDTSVVRMQIALQVQPQNAGKGQP